MIKYRSCWIALAWIVASIWLAACTPSPETHQVAPAHVEPIAGTDLSRIELTEKAAERLDIQTVPVREQTAARKRVFGGQVLSGRASVLVRVALNESDLAKVDRSQPVIVRPLEEGADGWIAQAIAAPDAEEATEALYLSVATESGFAPDQRVSVETSMLGSGAEQKVIPYAAVLYDTHGDTWVYTRPGPLVFVRAPIVVDYIDGDLAVLSECPPAGTEVVTSGTGELFGAESGIGGGGH